MCLNHVSLTDNFIINIISGYSKKSNFYNGLFVQWSTMLSLRSDGKRPDGITMVPRESGRCIIWDVTCVDTLAPTYRSDAVIAPGSVAARAERKKEAKYSQLSNMYKFIPIAIETLGAMGPKTRAFIKSLGKRITRQTGDQRETFYLSQRLSVAVQQGNSASVLGSLFC